MLHTPALNVYIKGSPKGVCCDGACACMGGALKLGAICVWEDMFIRINMHTL